MEPPRGVSASLSNFIRFLPYFIGLLLLGFIKGIIFCPIICLILTIGNSAIILGLWPAHVVWTYFCILSAKRLGPVMKIVVCIGVTPIKLFWPVFGVVGSILGGLAYGFLGPMFGTFKAVGEGKTDVFYHCIVDGTWDTVQWSFTFIRDLADISFYSYFSIMDDLRLQGSDGIIEIRLFYLPGAIIIGVLGFLVDFPVISLVAILKSPYMLFKGWHRLFHDLIGREGPFLETICVPFAGLAILLWPLAVAGAVLASMISSLFLGLYAAVVVYQVVPRAETFVPDVYLVQLYMRKESSFVLGISYIPASLSIYDEYSNDILDMPEGSCFPRPKYRRNAGSSELSSRAASFSRPDSFKNPPARSNSLKSPMIESKPFELLDSLLKECQRYGEIMVSEGLIIRQEIEDAKSGKDSGRVVSVGLPAYSLLQVLIRSAKANCTGILLVDNVTEITSTNRPKDTFFDWFLNPLLIIKDQIKAQNLSEDEEEYLGKLVLLNGDPEKLKNSNIGSPPESELRRAELNALARRLQGITKSISRYPTYKRRFDHSIKFIFEDLDKKDDSNRGPKTIPRSKSTFASLFTQKSFRTKTSNHGADREVPPCVERDVDIV